MSHNMMKSPRQQDSYAYVALGHRIPRIKALKSHQYEANEYLAIASHDSLEGEAYGHAAIRCDPFSLGVDRLFQSHKVGPMALWP